MIGQKFGNYVALSLLGEGGMGAVYLAEHPSIGRRVAIKVLLPERNSDAEVLGRFLNEARAANAIRHPNIIEILDSGTIENGAPYLVLELLEGESLRARMRHLNRLTVGHTIQFAYQIASALGAAHKKGIIHRDLKPENLFIVAEPTDPEHERIKVLDFGIAKLSQQDEGGFVKTRTGALMGTPVYMSPEQCLGTKDVDHHSDIYSLGVIMYEMLCGKPPFVSKGFGELVTMHLAALPVPLQQINPDVTADLQEVVLKCLKKRPEDRYASMQDLQVALKTAGGPSVFVRGSSPHLKHGDTAPTPSNNISANNEPKFARLVPARTSSMAPGNAVGLPKNATTLSGVPNDDSPRKTKRPAVLLASVVAAGLAGLLAIAVGPKARSPAKPTLVAPPTATVVEPITPEQIEMVSITVLSHPSGAEVESRLDQKVLGRTPLTLELPKSNVPLLVGLKLNGYAPVHLDLPLTGNTQQNVVLAAVAGPPPQRKPARRPPVPPKPQPPPENADEPAKL